MNSQEKIKNIFEPFTKMPEWEDVQREVKNLIAEFGVAYAEEPSKEEYRHKILGLKFIYDLLKQGEAFNDDLLNPPKKEKYKPSKEALRIRG